MSQGDASSHMRQVAMKAWRSNGNHDNNIDGLTSHYNITACNNAVYKQSGAQG